MRAAACLAKCRSRLIDPDGTNTAFAYICNIPVGVKAKARARVRASYIAAAGVSWAKRGG